MAGGVLVYNRCSHPVSAYIQNGAKNLFVKWTLGALMYNFIGTIQVSLKGLVMPVHTCI